MSKKIVKVLGIIKKNSGSHYHRIEYPLTKIMNESNELDDHVFEITLKESQDLTVEELESYNVITFNWGVEIPASKLGELQSKGVKIVYSLDDFWQFSDNHPYYNNPVQIKTEQNNVIRNLILSDAVIVTTERLALQVLPYNENVAIVPNFLDEKDFNLVKTESNKLRVGIIGSVSHAPDWELLKGVINRIAKNKDLVEKCQFVICGYSQGPAWDKTVNMFKVKKNLDIVVKEGKSVYEYMELYNDLDVVLMPLENTEFNVCKSALKLMECTLSKTVPVGSILYNAKELKGIVVAETPLQYEESLIKLLDKEFYNKVLDHIIETNKKVINFEERIKNTKAVFCEVYNNDLSPKLDDVEIYSITYDQNQFTEYKTYDNSHIRTLDQKSWRFEYNPIIDIVSNKIDDNGYLAILSWKFNRKTNITKNVLYRTLKFYKYQDYDFINLATRYWQNTDDYLNFSYKVHAKLEVLLKRLLKHLGKEAKVDQNNYTYSNFFIMRKELWKDYVENWIKPALEFMENDPEYFEDANYTSGLSKEKLKELTGLDNYTYHTFCLERLILYFINHKKLKVKGVV